MSNKDKSYKTKNNSIKLRNTNNILAIEEELRQIKLTLSQTFNTKYPDYIGMQNGIDIRINKIKELLRGM